MNAIRITLIAMVVALFSMTTAATQVGAPEPRPSEPGVSNDVESAELPVYGVIRDGGSLTPELPPAPVPPRPPELLPAATTTYEFVGVTRRELAGNRGILNYTLACQAEFARSRMCSVTELLRTRNVPRRLADTYAWIQPEIAAGQPAAQNCRGWMSDLRTDAGLAIAIDATCYAGLVDKTCDSRLAVACCAPVSLE